MQCSTAVCHCTAEPSWLCCTPHQLQTPSQQGNRTEILRGKHAGYPMSHGSQCWQEAGCRHKQVAQISSNERQETAKRPSNTYYNNLLLGGMGEMSTSAPSRLYLLTEIGILLWVQGLQENKNHNTSHNLLPPEHQQL